MVAGGGAAVAGLFMGRLGLSSREEEESEVRER